MKRLIIGMLCIAFILASTLVNATIVYTDITDGQPATIDLNNDGTVEFTITSVGGTGDYITYDVNKCNIIAVGTAASGWDEPLPMLLNASIGSTGNFIGAGDCAVTGWGGATTFPLNSDRYIGVSFKVGSNTYYGWIRVYVTGTVGNYIITYKDFAYENTPNTAILAGNKPTGIAENNLLNNNILITYPNPAKDIITMDFQNQKDLQNTLISIYNMEGQLLLQQAINQEKTELNISSFAKGVYFINISDDKNLKHIKFIKE